MLSESHETSVAFRVGDGATELVTAQPTPLATSPTRSGRGKTSAEHTHGDPGCTTPGICMRPRPNDQAVLQGSRGRGSAPRPRGLPASMLPFRARTRTPLWWCFSSLFLFLARKRRAQCSGLRFFAFSSRLHGPGCLPAVFILSLGGPLLAAAGVGQRE